jgi:3-keto-5-aminohexanoate cleavage enzyme
LDKLIVTAAITGSLVSREQNPDLPVTPEEIARASIDSARAGAAAVHLHVRDPETGQPVQEAGLFTEVIRRIRQESDVIINVSTGGGPGMTPEQRIGVIPTLASDPLLKPEMASLNAGSINFGVYSAKAGRFVMDAVQTNPWPELQRFAETMISHGVKPEIEAYEAGMIHNAIFLESIGALKSPLHFQFVLGVLGGMQPTVENMVFMKTSLPSGATWSVCAVGLDIFRIGPAAIAAGGHIRVGLEDTVYISAGERAHSNADLVTKTVTVAGLMGRETASPQEARTILGLAENN